MIVWNSFLYIWPFSSKFDSSLTSFSTWTLWQKLIISKQFTSIFCSWSKDICIQVSRCLMEIKWLFCNSCSDFWMAMTLTYTCKSSKHIHVSVTVDIPKIYTLTSLNDNRRRDVITLCDILELKIHVFFCQRTHCRKSSF